MDPLRTSNDPLVSLNPHQQQHGNTDGSLQPIVTDSKFLGFLCTPARTCCCGCTLRCTIVTFAVIALVLGSLSLLGAVVTIDNPSIVDTVLKFVSSLFMIGFGVVIWKAASEMNGDLAIWGLAALVCNFLVESVDSVIAIVSLASPETQEKIYISILEQSRMAGTPLPDQAEQIKHLVALTVKITIGAQVIYLFILFLITLFVGYIVWSFSVRAKRGETFLLSIGERYIELQHPTQPNQYVIAYEGMNFPHNLNRSQPQTTELRDPYFQQPHLSSSNLPPHRQTNQVSNDNSPPQLDPISSA